jgi:hypothetical protein
MPHRVVSVEIPLDLWQEPSGPRHGVGLVVDAKDVLPVYRAVTTGLVQIPPDLVVKSQAADIVEVILHASGDPTSFKRSVETGNQGVSCSSHLRL